jgi:carboxyl-terminal processing protease
MVRTESVHGDHRLPDGSWEWFIEGEPSIAFIRITGFGDHTLEELDRCLEEIAAKSPPEGIVLDLRGNPGGLLAAAVGVCDRFLDEGVIVSTRGRSGPAGNEGMLEVRRATVGGEFVDVPMAVLVDGLTASAGEIVAACLQDNDRAAIVGSRTFGKGTVQSILPLSDGRSLVKLTTSEYLRPSKANIHRRAGAAEWGVSPDRGNEITPTAKTLAEVAAWRRKREAAYPQRTAAAPGGDEETSAADLPRNVDPLLARAIELLQAAR